MNCPQCDIQIGDGDAFCQNCGTDLAGGTEAQQPQPPAAAPPPTTPPTTPAADTRTGNSRVIAVVAIALVVVLTCGAIGAYRLFKVVDGRMTAGEDPAITSLNPGSDDSEDSSEPDRAPEDVIDDFYAAVASGDFDSVVVLFSEEMREFADPSVFETWEPPSYQVLSTDITELGYVYVEVQEYDGGFSGGIVTYVLIEEDNVWKIDELRLAGVGDNTYPRAGDSDEDPYASALDPETATGAVGTLLVALQNDDMSGMRAAASDYFEANNPDYFFPSSGALANFEILDVLEDGAVYIVIVREDWDSGPEEMTYVVIEEAGITVVDDVYYE